MFPHLLRTAAFYASTAFLAAFLLLLSLEKRSSAAQNQPVSLPRMVVVELFTSEGCSSCPPADALLKQLSEQQILQNIRVIGLEEHVDYWNHLGWTDPFSSNQFTQRQSDYAQVFHKDGVYTPEMVVDGESEFVGSRRLSALEAIQKAASQPKLEVALQLGPGSKPGKPSLEIQVQNPNGVPVRDLELWVAVTEKGLRSDVQAGENSGETLKHAAVVRSLRKLDTLHRAAYQRQFEVPLEPNWNKENLTVVVLLSEKNSRKIVGAATTPLKSPSAKQ